MDYEIALHVSGFFRPLLCSYICFEYVNILGEWFYRVWDIECFIFLLLCPWRADIARIEFISSTTRAYLKLIFLTSLLLSKQPLFNFSNFFIFKKALTCEMKFSFLVFFENSGCQKFFRNRNIIFCRSYRNWHLYTFSKLKPIGYF